MKREVKFATLDEGIRLFNAGRFFECHEVLERLWIEDRSEFRQLYQGLIKSAVGLHHAERGNLRGARKVLAGALEQVRPYAGRKSPVEVGPLIDVLSEYLEAVRAGRDIVVPHPKMVVRPARPIGPVRRARGEEDGDDSV